MLFRFRTCESGLRGLASYLLRNCCFCPTDCPFVCCCCCCLPHPRSARRPLQGHFLDCCAAGLPASAHSPLPCSRSFPRGWPSPSSTPASLPCALYLACARRPFQLPKSPVSALQSSATLPAPFFSSPSLLFLLHRKRGGETASSQPLVCAALPATAPPPPRPFLQSLPCCCVTGADVSSRLRQERQPSASLTNGRSRRRAVLCAEDT